MARRAVRAGRGGGGVWGWERGPAPRPGGSCGGRARLVQCRGAAAPRVGASRPDRRRRVPAGGDGARRRHRRRPIAGGAPARRVAGGGGRRLVGRRLGREAGRAGGLAAGVGRTDRRAEAGPAGGRVGRLAEHGAARARPAGGAALARGGALGWSTRDGGRARRGAARSACARGGREQPPRFRGAAGVRQARSLLAPRRPCRASIAGAGAVRSWWRRR
mmetsp:Transcript_4455/g.14794  ORF Transcript_4455/g.14794 Transcript_4455/m.14794 type:complete len:218 (-) Transcript_4455:478-1131(-)